MPNIPLWKKRLPMQLTWARMAIAPVFVLFYWDPANVSSWKNWAAAGFFVAASITDYFDGMLARKWKAQTNLGKFMDPIADKVLVSAALIMLIPTGRCSPVMALILLTRDILIGGIRSVAAADNVIIDAKAAGKWKTGIQMVGIPMMLVDETILGIPSAKVGHGLLWLSVILSVLSGYEYVSLYLRNRKSAY